MTAWCAVQTHARAEDKTAFHLGPQGYDNYLPKRLKRPKHARRFDRVPAPLFPRHLLVAFDPAQGRWCLIQSTAGVLNLVSFGSWPDVGSPEFIDGIRARHDEKGSVKTYEGCGFKLGERVQFFKPPLGDLEGLFECPHDEEYSTILLELLGRAVKVRVPLDAVYACA